MFYPRKVMCLLRRRLDSLNHLDRRVASCYKTGSMLVIALTSFQELGIVDNCVNSLIAGDWSLEVEEAREHEVA